jgi:hypothetical protein
MPADIAITLDIILGFFCQLSEMRTSEQRNPDQVNECTADFLKRRYADWGQTLVEMFRGREVRRFAAFSRQLHV